MSRIMAAVRRSQLYERRRVHPSELPEHLKDAVREARMDARHEHLNALRDENLTDFERELIAAVREARAHAEGRQP